MLKYRPLDRWGYRFAQITILPPVPVVFVGCLLPLRDYEAALCEIVRTVGSCKSIKFNKISITGILPLLGLEDRLLDRLYELLAVAGYPPKAIDWLRRHRLSAILILAFIAWVPFFLAGWLIWTLLT